ncbi:UNVERIFIED_ORG: integrase [Arthrobacter sp. UYEF13]
MLLLRWSGARRDEIRRLTCDCLDTYASGHPRLRIPVGKGHTERLIPLHPDAAALQEAINHAKTRKAAPRHDPTGCKPTSSKPNLNSATVCGCLRKGRANAN